MGCFEKTRHGFKSHVSLDYDSVRFGEFGVFHNRFGVEILLRYLH